MDSLKINCINNNLTFKGIKNTNKLAKVSKNITKNPMLPVIGLGGCVSMGIRYNEKENSPSKPLDNILDKIKELNKNIKTKLEAGENIKPEELKLTIPEEMAAHRLPDFSETRHNENFYDNLSHMDYTHIEIEDLKKEAAIIKNKQLKTITETICKNNQLNKSLLNFIRDIDAGLNNITDSKISKHLRAELKKLADTGYDFEYEIEHPDDSGISEMDYFFSLNSIAEIIDVYNTMTGKYSRYKAADTIDEDVYLDMSKPAEYMKNYRKYSPKGFENFIKALNIEGDKKHPIVKDFESLTKTEALELLSNKKEMLDYMYEKYYLSKITDAPTKKLCKEINQKYDVKILLSNQTRDIRKALKVIEKELEAWKEVSEGKAKLPRILDLNACDTSYEDSAAYTNIRGNIHHNGAKIYSPRILRHEIMHLNEPSMFAKYSADKELVKLIRSIIPSEEIVIKGKKKVVLDWDNCKYREEFLKAGITPEHTEYAYTNRNEFLAVAAEGDLSQYSPEFKEVLIKIGMPKFVFDLPVDDAEVEANVKMVKNILKNHPKAQYDKLVDYIEEERFQQMSPQEKLLSALFKKNWK